MDLYLISIPLLAVCYVLWKAFFAPIPYRKGTPHGQKKKVVVIGAGVSGIACAKEMMDEGHDVVIYEKNQNYGGLWSFSATDRSSARVYNKLITNSSAMVMAFSDHPPAKERFDDETREYHHDFPYHARTLGRVAPLRARGQSSDFFLARGITNSELERTRGTR
jgi:glycine/D-amino acid oxidase-like deaminating enzyme